MITPEVLLTFKIKSDFALYCGAVLRQMCDFISYDTACLQAHQKQLGQSTTNKNIKK